MAFTVQPREAKLVHLPLSKQLHMPPSCQTISVKSVQ